MDAVFVSNIRDKVDRKNLGKANPKDGHFNGPRYWIKGTAGRTRAIDTLTEELQTDEGRERAKKQIVSATEWTLQKGAGIILLAAGTKRLFEGSPQ